MPGVGVGPGAWRRRRFPGPSLTWRADNRGASVMEQGTQGGGNLSAIYSRKRSMPVPFRRFRVLVPVFWVTGSPLTDTLFAAQRSFAFALGATWQAGFTNRPAATPVTFSGGQVVTFNPGTWDANASLANGGGVCIVSDVIDLGATIPANTPFEFRSGITVAAAGALPTSGTYNGTLNTGHGSVAAASNLLGTGIAGTTTFAALPGSNVNTFWDNAILLVEAPASTRGVVSVGDSLLYAIAYDLGDDEGVGGIINRGLKSRSSAHLNLGRGSDGDFNLITPARWPMRQKLLQVITALTGSFTARVHANIHNDLTKTYPFPALARSTAYAKWACVSAGGIGQLVCTQAGTTSASALTVGAGVNRNIADGSAVWARLTTNTSGVAQTAALVAAQNMAVNDALRALLPGVPSLGWLAGPHTTTQTSGVAATNWGGATTRRGWFNSYLRDPANWDLFGHAGVIDANAVLEQGYPADSSLWADTNYTADGVHHSTAGALVGAPIVAGLSLL